MRFSLIVCNLFFACLLAAAQNANISFDHLTGENGLSGGPVSSIIRDSKGFMWIASADGLVRYDGYTMKLYNHTVNDSNSLADNNINKLFQDIDGNIWVATINGLSIYNPAKDDFITFRKDKIDTALTSSGINFLVQDKQKNIWITTINGIYIIDAYLLKNVLSNNNNSKIKFRKIESVNKKFSALNNRSDLINSTFFDHRGDAWITTSSGAYKMILNTNKNDFENARLMYFKNSPLDGIQCREVMEDDSGYIWITMPSGLVRTNNQTNFPAPDSYSFERIFLSANNIQEDKFNFLTAIAKDTSGKIYFGTIEAGLLIGKQIHIKNNKAVFECSPYSNVPFNPKSIISNMVTTLYADHSGLVWIGTDLGISILNPLKQNFNTRNISELFNQLKVEVTKVTIDHNNLLWIGTDHNGLFAYDQNNNPKINLLSIYPDHIGKPAASATALSNNTVFSILNDDKNNLWIGTADGLDFIDNTQLNVFYNSKNPHDFPLMIFKRFTSANTDTTCLAITFLSLLQTKNHEILFGTNGSGLFSIHSFDDKFPQKIKFAVHETFDAKTVKFLLEDHLQNIWVGTDNGLFMIDSEKKPAKEFSEKTGELSHKKISFLFEDSKYNIWIGTDGGGLNSYDPITGKFNNYTIENGLPNNVVNGILQDHIGNIWVSTNKGLAELNPEKNTFINYSENDGLTSNTFIIGAAYAAPDGEMFFGNNNGFNSFYPAKIIKNPFVPPVVITDFKIFDKSIFSPGFENIKTALFNDNFVQLHFNQNFFSFEFAALNYINSPKNQYKYKLDGVDANWIIAGNRRFASYTNIDPGTYTFHVTGSNNDGVWNQIGISITVTIIPPYYKTWWFRILIAFFIASLIFMITQMRVRAIRETKEREVIENAAKMKQQFLANMSHEIRTPMNAIVGMTRLLIGKDPRPDQKKYLSAIEQSSDNLLVIINDILDFSKIEAGKLELEFIPFSISVLMQGVYDTMQFKSREKNLQLSYKIEESVPEAVLGDRVRLNEVLLNLVGNAIKFTPQGSIKISCRNLGNYNDANGIPSGIRMNVEFTVADTGIGIPEDRLDSIFESFSQASSDTTRKFGGTGLGLTISKQLVELHGGKISVSSTPGSGTVFTFIIPFEIADKSLTEKEDTNDKKTPLLSLSMLNVLLVEDNAFNRTVAIDTLESFIPGISIQTAINGKQAIEKVNENNYDLILMDIQMPEMDGYEATQLIRSQSTPPKNKIIIIAMTAGALRSEIQKCFDSGMNDYITKPFDPHLLIEKITRFFPEAEKT